MSTEISPDNNFFYRRVQETGERDLEFEALLDYLKQVRGCDLTGYKRPGLMRRVQHRMQTLKIDSYLSYLNYLQSHSDEHLALRNDVLNNFTAFFRDRNAWSYLITEVVPQILANQQPDEVIRVWSAGCASGPEIYSCLILLAEILGVEFCLQRVQCYATDADADALQQAQQATYRDLEIVGIPPQVLEKYFEQTQQGYVFHPALRNLVTFQHHDLMKDAPLSDIDLLLCRNVLMYFTPTAQEFILTHLHLALKNTGFLFLGQVELLMSKRNRFTPVNLKQRIYAKKLESELDDNFRFMYEDHRSQMNHPLPTQNHSWKRGFESSFSDHLANRLTWLTPSTRVVESVN